MARVKAEYFNAKDKATGEIKEIQFIPPAPSDGDLGGISQEKLKQIDELKGDLNTLNEGGLILKEDFIGTQVNEWLNEHPEATTTVQDGSIGIEKLTDGAISELGIMANKNSYLPNLSFDTTDKKYIAWSSLWAYTNNLYDMKEQIDMCYGMFNCSILDIYTTYSDGVINADFGENSVQDVINACQYSISKGMPIRTIKIHCNISNIISDIGLENATALYKSFIDECLNNYGVLNPTYVTCLNEDYNAYSNSEYADSIVEILNHIKIKGYQCGITFRTDGVVAPTKVTDACDIICRNWYPPTSLKGKRTSYKDMEEIFDSLSSINNEAIKWHNMGKKFIISEFGICSDWKALEYPENYYDVGTTDTHSNIPAYWYFKIFFEKCFINIDELWIWYYVDTYNNPNCRKMFSAIIDYINGGEK